MDKLFYPAVFHPEADGGYSVDFPDLLGCVTEGDTLADAVKMAEDALGIYLYSLKEDKKAAPTPSDPADIETEGRDFVSLVEYDELEYLKRTDTYAIKKTVAIPGYHIYPAIIEHTKENYCLYFPDLPGCVASGDTIEKVVELAQEAAQEYLWELKHGGCNR